MDNQDQQPNQVTPNMVPPTEPTPPPPAPEAVPVQSVPTPATPEQSVPQMTPPQAIPTQIAQPQPAVTPPTDINQMMPPQPIPGQPAPTQVTPATTNGTAIAGLILAFFLPLIGLILSIVGLSQIKKRNQKGHGIAVAGIVISSIGCLFWVFVVPALVVTTFTGVQVKARNTERQTDIKAIHGQIEAYYAEHGSYPSYAQLKDSSWVSQNMPKLDQEALKDPKSTDNSISTTPSASKYAYAVQPDNCDNVKTPCSTYTLTATYEGGGTFAKTNLNN